MVELRWGTRSSPLWSGHATVSNSRYDSARWSVSPLMTCKYSSGLTGSAYRACGEAASALHAMALLQVHQAKALKDLQEGGHELCTPVQISVPCSEPTSTDTVQDQERQGEGLVSGSILEDRTWFPELMLFATAPPWSIPLWKDLLSQIWGTLWHPCPYLWKLHVWSLDGTQRF